MSFDQHVTYVKDRPVLTGLMAVLAVMSTGAAIAFATGMTAPQMAEAIFVGPPCCTTTPPPVIPPVVTPPPVVVPPVVVEDGPPCCTTTPPPVIPPVVTPPPAVETPVVVEDGPPCCTTTPPPVQPPVEQPITPPTVTPPVVDTPTYEPPTYVPPVVTPPVIVPDQPTYIPPVVDVCPNISGNQSDVPGGYYIDGNGNCVQPPTDLCPNLPGTQTAIPSGYYVDASGNCVQPPVDVCPNLAGTQTGIPAGYIKDANGNCVPPPVDMCPNIPGTQATVPNGYIVDANGNCVQPQPEAPVCTLSVSPSTITQGGSAVLSWSSQKATSFTIDQGIGGVTPVSGGSRSVSPSQTTTYTGTATGPGGTVHCSATITVVPPTYDAPVCTLTASPTQINQGGSATLSWTTQNATTVSINQGIGGVTLNGSRSVSPAQTTTYTLTATGPGGTVNCTTTIVVVPPTQNPLPVCTLTALPTTINQGSAATLSWTTHNATTVTINQGIGAVNLNGSTSVMPGQTTTYVLTATGPGGTVNCSATVTVITQNPLPVCTLSISASSVVKGGSATLSWTTQNATSVNIDQGIGGVSTSGSRTITPDGTVTYTLTASGPGGTVNCPATITVTTTNVAPSCFLHVNPDDIEEGERATITWGGTHIQSVRISEGIGSVAVSGSKTVRPDEGRYTYVGTFHTTTGDTITCSDTLRVDDDHNTHKRKPRVVLDSLPTPDEQDLSFIYLADMPYTGLDLGPFGTLMYWAMLILWSAAAAYLVIFNAIPMLARKFSGTDSHGGHDAHGDSHDAHAAPSHDTHVSHAVAAAPAMNRYSSYEGFRSFAKEGSALTIDDIVSGLAREAGHVVKEETPVHAAPAVEPIFPPTMVAAAPVAAAAPAVAYTDDVAGFLAALLNGDRDQAFGHLRQVTKSGGDSEAFLTQAVCALDDAYRAQIDGTPCHPEIARITQDCAPSFLERLVASLTTAVDGSYSAGVTGVKLAVTRALAIVNG